MADFPPGAGTRSWRTGPTRFLADETVTEQTVLFGGRVAGNVVSFQRDGKRKVGYWVGGEYWGKGVATDAPSQFLGHAEVGRPLRAALAKHDVGSIRVLEKCGFTVLGEEDGEYVLRPTAD
jgi:RimJ/RimL family protein N-acetyltransferase